LTAETVARRKKIVALARLARETMAATNSGKEPLKRS
jgi:hypothetical protein